MDKNREELLRARKWSAKFKDETSPASDAARREVEQQHEEFNARVHQALAETPVPPTLRDQILARRIIIPVSFWKTPRALAALAAAFIILASGLIVLNRAPKEDQSFAGFRSRMVGFALREYRMDIHTTQLPEVRNFLAQNGAPAQFTLPGALAATPVKGGAKLAWQGQSVGMVCFTGPAGQTFYMFVIDAAFALTTAAPEVATHKSLNTATWTADGKTFLLAAPIPAKELEKLVRT